VINLTYEGWIMSWIGTEYVFIHIML